MATSHYVACHTCKKRWDTELLTKASAEDVLCELVEGEHAGHQMTMICDAAFGWDDETDRIYDQIKTYELEALDEC